MDKIAGNNYIVIQGWMCTELELKGNELLIYALIYGFTQDGESWYCAGRRYIANTFNISYPTVDKALKNLVDNGFIEKQVVTINGVQFNQYKNSWGVVKKLSRGSKETLPNNINNTKNNNSKELLFNNTETGQKFELSHKPVIKKQSLFQSCVSVIDSFTQNPNLRSLLVNYLAYRLEVKQKPLYFNMWKGMIAKLADYTVSEQITMVQQSLDKGWLSFYEVSTHNSKRNSEPVNGSCQQDTEEDKTAREAFISDLQKKGKRTEF